ncbi:hypothetical protein OESDEN_24930, partial [Oesophagostomum dentatum]
MDENFNSLAEEQKEASDALFREVEEVRDESPKPEVPEENIIDEFAKAADDDSNNPDKPSLEKLAELTAVMSRFELDIVSANNSNRIRSKSEPISRNGRPPRTVIVRSCDGVNERLSATESQPCTGYIWSGELPPRNYSNPTFSSKIFVGGVPWDITETALIDAFSPYGNCRVEWPCKEVRSSHSNFRTRSKVTGYVYMVFETEKSVKSLLQDCSQEFGSAGEWYFKLKARRNQSNEIRQVFVGALHGMLTAHVLFSIMNELYGNVVFVGIDTDKYKYPI